MTDRSDSTLDNKLALGQLLLRCERTGTPWMLASDYEKVTPEFRYELRIFEGPARAIYHGETATHAASKALAVLDEHRVGWEDPAPRGCKECGGTLVPYGVDSWRCAACHNLTTAIG